MSKDKEKDVTLSFQDFGFLQNQLLTIKHQNFELKKNLQAYNALVAYCNTKDALGLIKEQNKKIEQLELKSSQTDLLKQTLQESIREYEQQISSLKAQLKQSQEVKKKQDSQEKEQSKEVKDNSNELPHSDASNQSPAESGSTAESLSQQKYDKIITQMANFEEKSRDLTKQKEELSHQLQQTKSELDELKDLDQKKTHTIESMREKIKNLEQLLDNSTKQSTSIQQHRKQLESQRNVMAFDMVDMEKQVNQLRKQASEKFQLQRKHRELEIKFQDFREQINKFQQSKAKQAIKQVQIQNLRSQKQELQKQIEKKQEQIQSLTNQMRQLNENYNVLKQEKIQMLSDINQQQSQMQQILIQKAEHMDKIQQQSLEITDLKSQLQNTGKKYQTSAKHLKSEIDRQKDNQNNLKIKNRQLQNQIKTLLAPSSAKIVGECGNDSSGGNSAENLLIKSLSVKLSRLEEEKDLLLDQISSLKEGLKEVEQHKEGSQFKIEEEMVQVFQKLDFDHGDRMFVQEMMRLPLKKKVSVFSKMLIENVNLRNQITKLSGEINELKRNVQIK